ncbi:hypothetical protein HPB51_012477 [Rhipicephalus microplus]|uniref:THAP-type domain-containing protein n=1 Tax=Rhipicephalus microplus TaxID=6941 RepID=A0A9J6E9T8_RHIMP|nr:hypothetical protein HPB51_012477 [Rhipicephalus microplus]
MPKQQRYCFVPGCKIGCGSAWLQGRKLSLFGVPVDDERRRAWERAISRADKRLGKNCVVCELHFEERFIVRNYKHLINGECVEIPRGRPTLTKDAIPTILPTVPAAGLCEPLPLKIEAVWSNGRTTCKRQKDDSFHEEPDSDETDVPTSSNCDGVYGLEGMTQATFQIGSGRSTSSQMTRTWWLSRAYVQGVHVKTVDVDSVRAVRDLLFEIDAMIPCEGFEKETGMEAAQVKTKHRLHGGKLHSLRCCGTVQNRGQCLQCKYLHKLLKNQVYYKRAKWKQASTNLAQKLKRKNELLRRQEHTIARLSETIEMMKEDIEAIVNHRLKKMLQNLPKEQQV